MRRAADILAKTRDFLPDLDGLEERLLEEPETIVSDAFPSSERELESRGIVGAELVELNPIDAAVDQERMRLVEAGGRAVGKIRRDGVNAVLEPDERDGYEAIISIFGRPAILIQSGSFFPPPQEWEILEGMRDGIEEVCQSVGRIEAPGHPRLDWIGTGFLVAEDIIMTNRHVAMEFCRWGQNGQWVFEPGIKPRIDYVEELSASGSAEFLLTEVIGIHETFDLALFRTADTSPQGAAQPEPLTIASDAFDPMVDRKVYVLGYPAWDGRRNDPEIMRRIFSNIYGVKRLQPGKITRLQLSLLNHDCSTLGGNSGSCVVDLETNQVVGLHFAGRYLEANSAVALWTLTDDPLLKAAGVNFD